MCASLTPPSAASPVTLFPNPATSTVRLSGAGNPTAELLDAVGRTVRTWPLEADSSNLLDLEGLPAGLYTVRCGAAARKLVIE